MAYKLELPDIGEGVVEAEVQQWFVKPGDVVAVVGAGPAGLMAAVTAAQRGHRVSLYESKPEIGGQFNLAKKVPGKNQWPEPISRRSMTSRGSFGFTKQVTARPAA
mgnify:CR=1 FL=1